MADSDKGVARLLERYVSKPPKVHLTADEKKELIKLTKNNSSFRTLKDVIRLRAWARSVPSLNMDATEGEFPIKYAREQGFRDGMLTAIDLLEELLLEEDDAGE